MKKFLILLIVSLAVVLSVSFVAAGGLFGDDVNVRDLTLQQYNNQARDLDTFVMRYTMSIVPTKNIDHIISMEIQNCEVSWGHNSLKFNPTSLKYDKNAGNNMKFDLQDTLFKDDIYYFDFELRENSISNRQDISHIKGDIVVNTTTQNNVVIGHIDSDINLDHTKKNGQQSGVPGRVLTYY